MGRDATFKEACVICVSFAGVRMASTAALDDKGNKGRKRRGAPLRVDEDLYLPVGKRNLTEREKDDVRREEQEASAFRLQFEHLGKELRVAFPEKVKRWEEIIGSTILEHEARMAEIRYRLENIRATVKLELSDMEGQKVREYSDLFEKYLGAELQKRVKLEDSLKACEENLQVEKKKRIALEEELKISTKNAEEAKKERQTCQICLDKPPSAVILPCLHFLYCSGCLQTHQKASNECPTCSASIVAVLNCNLNGATIVAV